MSPVYLNPQHSSSIPFLELKGDQHHNHPILGYLHDHVTNNTTTYFSSSIPENHHLSTQYLAMDFSRHTHDKVVEKLILSQEKATNNNRGQVIQSSTQVEYASNNIISGCNNVNSFNQGDLKPKKCKPTKLRILHAPTVTATATDKPKKIIRERDHHASYRKNTTESANNNNGVMRMCTDCHTTTTPLWRSGPHGPKSLCNACGIRQRKARRAAMAAASAKLAMDEATTTSSMSSSTTTTEPPKLMLEEMSSQFKLEHAKSLTLPLKKRSKTLINSSWSSITNDNNHQNNINYNYNYNYNNNDNYKNYNRDEEEGAILLMALSCG